MELAGGTGLITVGVWNMAGGPSSAWQGISTESHSLWNRSTKTFKILFTVSFVVLFVFNYNSPSYFIIVMLLNGSDLNERLLLLDYYFFLFNRWSAIENEGMMRFLMMIIEDLRGYLTCCWVHVWHSLIKWQMTVLRFKNNFSFSCLLSLATDVVGSWRYRPLEQKLTNTLTNKHPAHPDSFQSLFGICWGLLEKEKVRFEWGYNKITQAYTHLLF